LALTPPPRLLRGGRLFDGRRFLGRGDLRTGADGRIAEIAPALDPRPDEEVLELEGRLLLPGLIDCHVHFREPGLERKEGYATGSSGALHGGVTTVLEIQNNPPLMTSLEALEAKLALAARVSRVDFGCYASLVPEAVGGLALLRPRTPAAKCFLGASTGSGGVDGEERIRELFGAAAAAGLMVVAHCEDNAVLSAAREEARDDPAPRHDRLRPAEAEIQSVRSALRAAEATGARLHVFHLSTAEGGRLVAEAVARGLPVSASTAPHYLLLTAEDAARAPQNRLKVNPAIHSQADRRGLAELLAAGALACVGTDHAPHPLSEKARPYAKAPSGFPSVDLLLPLLFAVHDRAGVPLERVLAAATADAAAEFGLGSKGRLEPGADADLVVADPETVRVVEESRLPSRSRWSPYQGWRLRGFASRVFLHGWEVFADGTVQGPPRGRSLF